MIKIKKAMREKYCWRRGKRFELWQQVNHVHGIMSRLTIPAVGARRSRRFYLQHFRSLAQRSGVNVARGRLQG